MNAIDWLDRAACREIPHETFFDETGAIQAQPTYSSAAQRWYAKKICATCPVARQCLDLASRAGAEFGVFGGLDQKERAVLRRRHGERGVPSATLAELALRMRAEGLAWADIAHRLGHGESHIRAACRQRGTTNVVVVALREHAAWASAWDGASPAEIAVRHKLPQDHAAKMCHAVDGLRTYSGPRAEARYVRRNEPVPR